MGRYISFNELLSEPDITLFLIKRKLVAKKKNLVEEEISRLELEKTKPHNAEHTSLEMCPVLRGLVDEVGTAIKQQNGYIFIADFIEKVGIQIIKRKEDPRRSP